MKTLLITIALFFFVLIGFAQSPGTPKPSTVIKLWPKDAPGAITCPDYKETTDNNGWFEKVSVPELAVFLPPVDKSDGTAVLICPGGGYVGVASGQEHIMDIVKKFKEHGIAAFVLKYRLPSDKIMKDKSIGPLQDAQKAMRIIRGNAAKWHLDPAKIGVMGGSAGGHLAATLSTHYDAKVYDAENVSARPDFTVLYCPVITLDTDTTCPCNIVKKSLLGHHPDKALIALFSNELQVTDQTPPAFIFLADNDELVPPKQSFLYFQALRDHQIPCEMHICQDGKHNDLIKMHWHSVVPTLVEWMKKNGWLMENKLKK
jgi:acetyl esterase/lipase